MIGRLSGTLLSKQPPLLMLDVGGVGYEIEAPVSVFYDLPEVGKPVTLLTHLQIRDDAHVLYGFDSERQRLLFRQLLKISGIGAKLALTILSGASGDDLARFVAEDDTASLTRLPGIGKKTAERIIIELRDKLEDLGFSGGSAPAAAVGGDGHAVGEAEVALAALGFKPAEVGRLLKKVAAPGMRAEELIREALKATVKPG